MALKKEYTNGEVTIVWEADKCSHSGICVKGLPKVFRPKVRPWVNIKAADTDALVKQVKRCPTGALSFYMNGEKDKAAPKIKTKVEVLENGPLLVYGALKVVHKDGKEELKTKTTAFCRCGASNNKPFCDGAHSSEKFIG